MQFVEVPRSRKRLKLRSPKWQINNPKFWVQARASSSVFSLSRPPTLESEWESTLLQIHRHIRTGAVREGISVLGGALEILHFFVLQEPLDVSPSHRPRVPSSSPLLRPAMQIVNYAGVLKSCQVQHLEMRDAATFSYKGSTFCKREEGGG